MIVTPLLIVGEAKKRSRVNVYTLELGAMPRIVVLPSNVGEPSEPSP